MAECFVKENFSSGLSHTLAIRPIEGIVLRNEQLRDRVLARDREADVYGGTFVTYSRF